MQLKVTAALQKPFDEAVMRYEAIVPETGTGLAAG